MLVLDPNEKTWPLRGRFGTNDHPALITRPAFRTQRYPVEAMVPQVVAGIAWQSTQGTICIGAEEP